MKDTFLEAADRLEAGQRLVLARIIRQAGSAPRSVGTRCLVAEDGILTGTIGGGLLEHQVMVAARASLQEGTSRILHFQLAGEDVAKTDMLCGGIADVYLEPLAPGNPSALEQFRRIRDLILEGGRGVLLTRVAQGISVADQSTRLLWASGEPLPHPLSEAWRDLGDRLENLLEAPIPSLESTSDPDVSLFVEPIQPEDVLLVFGAGHISTFLAPLARMVGFRVVVIDDREEFANRERFRSADEILVAPIPRAFERIPITDSTYIAIITRGHVHDHAALKAALVHDAAYVGMIGSRRKRDVVYRALLDEGVPRGRLARVHSPIGLEIGAETPEEIAVSIVGQLIEVRASRRKERAPRGKSKKTATTRG